MNDVPYVKAEESVKEFTLRSVILGLILGVIFGASNAYLGLKVGTTVSASIPAAVISMGVLRTFFRRVSILENNLVQTIASVGEGLAAGVIFTAPALFILGKPPGLLRIFLLSLLGGILGVLFMIPMRRYIIVHEHKKIPFPEGTACAEILKSSHGGRSGALMALIGILVGAIYKVLQGGLNLFNEVLTLKMPWLEKTEASMDATPSLLGVGYIIGTRTAALLFSGGAIAWWVIIPLIRFFGQTTEMPIAPATTLISAMSADEIWSNYIRYIGAGGVAIGGLYSLFHIAPMIKKTLAASYRELISSKGATQKVPRTERDISLKFLLLGSIAVIITLWLYPGMPMNFLTILMLVIIGFFFVAVTSLTVGIVGSTSNPVSGMTITTLLITCFVFLLLGWTEKIYLIGALTMSIVANVAIAMASTTSQDLKTGYILGATPKTQQIAEILGLILPAAAIGGTLYLLDNTYGLGSARLPAPQGTMLALLAQGILQGKMPFTLMGIGAILGLIIRMLSLPILPFAIGLYLPLSLSTPIMLGGIVSWLTDKKNKNQEMKKRGLLTASGLIAGDACTGVILSFLTALGLTAAEKIPTGSDAVGMAAFVVLASFLGWIALKNSFFFYKKKG